jgi:nitrate/TMAO reductase-like tetraheme cytochrome c subunit
MNHTLVTATRCDTCHNGSYATQGTSGAQAMVTTHIPITITSGLDCNTCHKITAAASIASMSWLTEKMNHNAAQGGGPVYCVTCHLSGVTYLGSAQKVSHNGASTAKDCSNSSCHKPKGSKGTVYVSWK